MLKFAWQEVVENIGLEIRPITVKEKWREQHANIVIGYGEKSLLSDLFCETYIVSELLSECEIILVERKRT